MKKHNTFLLLILFLIALNTHSQINEINFNYQPFNSALPPRTGTTPMSIKLLNNYGNGGPTTYGTIMEIYGQVGHQTGQLYFGGWDNSKIRYRQSFYAEPTWSSWITMLDSKNDVESAGNLKVSGIGANYFLNGNVGIGTTTPTEKLEISGNTKINGNLTFSNYGGGFYMLDSSWIRTFGGKNLYHDAGFMRTDGTFQVGPNGDRFVVNSNGNVGLGTTTPTEKLEISGNTKINGNLTFSNYGGGLYMLDSSWIRTFGGKSFYHDAGIMRTDGTMQVGPEGDRFVVNQSGNVGIGTTNPTAKLHVAGTIIGQDFISNGINSFIFHTPDDGRKSLHIAPYENGNWNWGKEFILNDGNAALKGRLEAKEIKVTTTPTADFVFGNEYILPTLESVEKHIKDKKHLPEIASATEMEQNGVNVGEFQIKLLQKIEELTLYVIELKKEMSTMKNEIKFLKRNK